jgi:adenylate cyclase
MNRRWSLTLRQLFLLSLLGLAVLLGVLFYFVYSSSHQSILDDSRQLQQEVGQRLKVQVLAFRDQASDVADDIERELQHGLINLDDRDGIETALYTQVLNHADLAEVTFTHGDATGLSDDFQLLLAPDNRWRISVYRSADPAQAQKIITDRVTSRANQPNDPTQSPTFTTPTMQVNFDQPVWSDLHWSELAPGGEASHSRVEVTVQKSIFDGPKFLGVVRVGLLEARLNQIMQQSGNGQDRKYTCFICDDQGRLVTSVTPRDHLAVVGDDIRIQSPDMPAYVAKALEMPALRDIHDKPPDQWTPVNGRVVAGAAYLVSFVPMDNVQDLVLGVIASEQSYLGNLLHTRNLLLADSAVVMAVILMCGVFTLRAVRRGLARVVATTSRMREFDFAPSPPIASFRDIQTVLESLEQAKTAMRAMGKYVPVDLVRDLYRMNLEPMLGGELRELTIMFTDLQGFTSLAETLATDQLAIALGHYFQAMTGAIHQQGGTIDKYIGDSIMAIWNAPAPCANHSVKACAAALGCARATERLFASPVWHGMPPLITRYGLHRGRVMAGHFGAPDRLSYTAQGDGVNLASRLEGLNKYYGTTILVSETVYEQAAQDFHFRLLDRVAVKGRKTAVAVYELLGIAAERNDRAEAVKTYEAALALYAQRDFDAALNLLQTNTGDPPSDVLAERCRHFIKHPPPQDWQGEFMSTMK